MTQLAATGPMGLAFTGLQTMIAESSAFQTRRDVADAAAARPFIHLPWLEVDVSQEADRPFALIEQGAFGWELDAGGDRNYLRPQGSLKLKLADNDRLFGDYENSFIDFANFTDGVIEAIADAAALDDNLAVERIALVTAAMQNSPAEAEKDGLCWAIDFEVFWRA